MPRPAPPQQPIHTTTFAVFVGLKDNHLENRTDLSSTERERERVREQTLFLSHFFLLLSCCCMRLFVHTLPLCLFLHNFLLSLVQCIFHILLTWPGLVWPALTHAAAPNPAPAPAPAAASCLEIVVSTNLFTWVRVRAHNGTLASF